jgi:hypothetical protein
MMGEADDTIVYYNPIFWKHNRIFDVIMEK